MKNIIIFISLFIFAWGIGAWLIFYFNKKQRRKKLLSSPLPENLLNIVKEKLPPYKYLNAEEKRRLQGTINVFLAEKVFEGCGGLEITDEIRVTVAAQACMLLLNRDIKVFPRLKSILIYPDTYIVNNEFMLPNNEVSSVRLGESWQSGVVVLAWNSVQGGIHNFHDGRNVTIHEFAHQLDQEDGLADGAPILHNNSEYKNWAEVFSTEYENLKNELAHGISSEIDPYGATNPAEFFAVVTETFFEKPYQLQKHRPQLYDALLHYYCINPMKWS